MAERDGIEDSEFRAGRGDTFSGGGGLLSTAHDYLCFAEMLRRGGKLDGERLLDPRTVALMTANHLPGDIADLGPKTWAETSFEGVGFGLGVWVMGDPARAGLSGSPGDYGWGGVASTVFWVDPVQDIIVLFLTQLSPSGSTPYTQAVPSNTPSTARPVPGPPPARVRTHARIGKSRAPP